MKVLGALGIDFKTLLIQALNFLVLFLILKWLFFKPFIRALKKEKKATDQLKKSQEEMIRQKENWQKEREKALLKARAKVEAILAEAGKISAEIKRKTEKRSSIEEKETIALIRKHSQSILDEYKEKLVKNYREKIIEGILGVFQKDLSEDSAGKIQNDFWPDLLKKIEKLAIDKIPALQLAINQAEALSEKVRNALVTANFSEREISLILRGKMSDTLLKKIEKLAIDKIPALKSIMHQTKNFRGEKAKTEDLINILEGKILIRIKSSLPLTKLQGKELHLSLQNKFPKKILDIKEEIDKNLIAGFSLELKGILIEKNLKSEIEKIFAL